MKLTKTQQNYISTWAKRIRIINTLGGKCENCNKDDIFTFHVHHKDPDLKEFKISEIKNHNWKIILKEIEKCQLLCGNCHAELHYKGGRSGTLKTHFLKNNKKDICCARCRYKGENIQSLVFHHNEIKKFNIADFFARKCTGLKFGDFLEEIEKCSILCVNCHIKEHIDLEKFNNVRSEIIKRVECPRICDRIDVEGVKKLMDENKGVCEISKIMKRNKSSIFYVMERIKRRDG